MRISIQKVPLKESFHCCLFTLLTKVHRHQGHASLELEPHCRLADCIVCNEDTQSKVEEVEEVVDLVKPQDLIRLDELTPACLVGRLDLVVVADESEAAHKFKDEDGHFDDEHH